jgi:hypothetical protein
MGEASNKFIADFSTMVNTILDERAIEVGGMSGPALARAIQDGTREIRENMERMAQQVGVPIGAVANGPVVPLQARHTWQLHLYGGTFHVIPQQWRFPSCTPFNYGANGCLAILSKKSRL